ncbi:MAG: hypothetical protein OXE94_13970 [Aestuariivita sp.]|nr:hypothetical protein [Aestuariivita sp.]MCY4202277.1 hypothetical protein [Aestuariivita sp.]MCY4289887.1 hypothetical protein [Aestuariivita sp.]MCY4346723.1 hypothetical protein [Aestuariivita sp.]
MDRKHMDFLMQYMRHCIRIPRDVITRRTLNLPNRKIDIFLDTTPILATFLAGFFDVGMKELPEQKIMLQS